MSAWVLLLYKIPPQPTAGRVYVWRKLKRLGALLLHDAAWVLPATPRTREQFQWLASEINELGGSAFVWEGQLVLAGQAETLEQQFIAQVDVEYSKLLAALKRKKVDRAALAQRYQQIQAEDYFQSALGKQVRTTIMSARGGAA